MYVVSYSYLNMHLKFQNGRYTRELALTKRTRYNATQPTHVDMRRVSLGHSAQTTTRKVGILGIIT